MKQDEVRARMIAITERLQRVGSTGDLPRFTDPQIIDLANTDVVKSYGIMVSAPGLNNVLVLERDQPALDMRLDAGRAKNTRIVIGKSAQFTSVVTIIGDDALVCMSGVSAKQGRTTLKINTDGDHVTIHLGSGFTSVNSHIIMIGDDCLFSTGPDCMFSWGITLHNYDHHTIFNLESGEPINRPGNIRIGRHVWLGQDVVNFGAADVGEGSIIAARSAIGSSVPPFSLAGGTPTKVIRRGVSWARERYGDLKAIERVRDAINQARAENED